MSEVFQRCITEITDNLPKSALNVILLQAVVPSPIIIWEMQLWFPRSQVETNAQTSTLHNICTVSFSAVIKLPFTVQCRLDAEIHTSDMAAVILYMSSINTLPICQKEPLIKTLMAIPI